MTIRAAVLCLPLAFALAAPAAARDSLGVFEDWGAFIDPEVPRCYAIAQSQGAGGRPGAGHATIGTWPARSVRGQLAIRPSRPVSGERPITLTIGDRRFTLTGSGTTLWAQDRTMDAAIAAAMRSATSMQLTATGTDGRRVADRYALAGAATAMDAATVGCARLG